MWKMQTFSFDGRIVRKFTLVALLAEALLEKRAEHGLGVNACWGKYLNENWSHAPFKGQKNSAWSTLVEGDEQPYWPRQLATQSVEKSTVFCVSAVFASFLKFKGTTKSHFTPISNLLQLSGRVEWEHSSPPPSSFHLLASSSPLTFPPQASSTSGRRPASLASRPARWTSEPSRPSCFSNRTSCPEKKGAMRFTQSLLLRPDLYLGTFRSHKSRSTLLHWLIWGFN